ncbi:MAG: hypothetical protein KAQ85_01405 [Thermodesulfovibrionia bacterium]|nr:hypothetical protein [Thermodesulfovibrionia bacterium]
MNKLSNLFPILLVVYIVKSFIVSPSLYDFGVVFLMVSAFLYKMKIDQESASLDEEVKVIISQFETKVNEKIDTLVKIQNEDRLAAESRYSSISLGTQYQSKPQRDKANYGWGKK